MENDAEAKLQGQKDLKDQDSEKSKRKGELSLVIVISGETHKMNCLNSYKAERGLRLNISCCI
jgi:hypothetical protein